MVLTTLLPDVTLRELSPSDALSVYELVQANRSHLTSLGDYGSEVAASAEIIATELAVEPQRHKRFGIFNGHLLVGRVDLTGVEPPRYSIGYWLAASHEGRGIATEAVRSALDFAFTQLGATDIFAGVTHGNDRSIALLERLNFEPVKVFDTYTRFHLGSL